MKNKKFSIEVIEEGRLSKQESNEIVGGDSTPCNFICSPANHIQCAVLMSCNNQNYGVYDDEGTLNPLCPSPSPTGNYFFCMADPANIGDGPYIPRQ